MENVSTKLKEGDDPSQNMLTAPIRISDASSMYRAKIHKNEKPYVATVLRYNNSLVDEWREKVLRKMANKNMSVPAGVVHQTWQIFLEGKEIASFREHESKLPKQDEDLVNYWADWLEKSDIGKMRSAGNGVVSTAWNIVTSYIRRWCAEQKWGRIYSKSENPADWFELSFSHKGLFNGDEVPLLSSETMKEISEKVTTILKLPIEPTN